MEENKRVDLDLYYLKMAYLVSERSTCIRRHVGCVLVSPTGHVLSTAFNGIPEKLPHCTNETCIRKKLNIPSGEKHELCMGAHAESNAIAFAARNGSTVEGGTIYITTQPCIYCAKIIVNAGIKRIVYCEKYGKGLDDLTKTILQNIEVVQIDKEKIRL